MDQAGNLFLGFDFGTESVRALLVDRAGRSAGSAVVPYAHAQIVPGSRAAAELFPVPLPAGYALQHPADWMTAAASASRSALAAAGGEPAQIVSIGVDFTSCTVLPCNEAGEPLCTSPVAANPHAWPKLWKHHGAVEQTRRINDAAHARREPWLGRYGGAVGLEWLFPKLLEVVEEAPHVADAAAYWIEAGDWFVWRLTRADDSRGDAGLPVRSTCQAGYKGCWSPQYGFPSGEFLRSVHPRLAELTHRLLRGRFVAPGRPAGLLSTAAAGTLGLHEGIPVSAAIIDAHAGVPGAGVGEPGTLVMVLGTSACHMLMSERYAEICGVAGAVRDGILPGLVGYETGQAAVGDAFDLVRRLTGGRSFAELDAAAAEIAPGADGVLCLDWFNGCRTPLMDGSLTGAFAGLTMHHAPPHLYRAALEASAMGLRWVVETLRGGGLDVNRFVATGGLSRASPLFVRVCASALGMPIAVHSAEHGPALGAAIIGAVASGAFESAAVAAHAMAGEGSVLPPAHIVPPRTEAIRVYDGLYRRYRDLAGAWRSLSPAAHA